MNEQLTYLLGVAWRSVAGVTGATFAAVMPWQEHMEWGVRMAGGLLGVAVALLTVVSLWRGLKK
jgi:heme A synthase